MDGTVIVTTASVLVGALIGGTTRRMHPVLGRLRTFAVAAVLSGVMVHLLPESIDALGGVALLVFLGALALPSVLAPLARKLIMRGERSGDKLSAHGIGAEFVFLGLAFHQFSEALALGTFAGPSHDGHEHGGLVLAVAAHTVPLTAIVIGGSARLHGQWSAVRRTLLLVAVTGLGFAAAGTLDPEINHLLEPWLAAAVGGFLAHVLLHEVPSEHRRPLWLGISDLGAMVAGVMLPLLGAQVHHGHAGDEIRGAVGSAFIELVAETGPALLLGLVLAALLQRWGSGDQVRGGLELGPDHPLSARAVSSIAQRLSRRRAGPAMVAGFAVAASQLAPEALTLGVHFLGWPFMLARVAAALLLAYGTAVVFARSGQRTTASLVGEREDPVVTPEPITSLGRMYAHFDELLLRTAPWVFVGLVAAAFVQVALPHDALEPLAARGLDVLLVGLVALPSYVCAAAATPLAAVLLMKGLSPGAVLMGLLLGPATNLARMKVLRRGHGWPTVAGASVVSFVACWGLSVALNLAAVPVQLPIDEAQAHEHGLSTLLSVAFLASALAVQIVRGGLRPWLEVLDGGGRGHQHCHET